MAMPANLETIANEMAEFAADIVKVRIETVSDGPYEDANIFIVWLPMEVSKDTLISLCQGWALCIRKSLPESQDEWASFISVRLPWGSTLGVWCVGWVGHEDEWHEDAESGLAEWLEWQGLYRRLDEYLQPHGVSDWQGTGDYFLFDEWSGNPEQSFTIYRIEFLTPNIVSGVQKILADGYAHWVVYVVLDLLPPVPDIASTIVIDIYADRIVESWDRALMVERLGDRLKF